jgi:hypothetical protein
MRPEEDVEHYIPINEVLQIEDAVGISEFFQQLTAKRAGGAVVWTNGTRRYVDGSALAAAVLDHAKSVTPEKATSGTVGDYLKRIVTYPVESQLLTVDSTIEPAKQDGGAPKVLHPVVAGDVIKGFSFAHAVMRKAAVVPPPVWVCQDGHTNDDLGDGYCSQCPRPIKELQS